MATKKEPNKPKKKMSPNSLKNLEATKFNNLSPERRREIARMGAEATNKKINTRKTFRLDYFPSLPNQRKEASLSEYLCKWSPVRVK